MNRIVLIAASIAASLALGLAACAPKPKEEAKAPEAAPAAEAPVAPDVAAAAANGTGDPRIPTVDPATINEKSSVADVMHAYVIPGSETLFAAESEDAPKDDAGWAKLRSAAQDVITGCKFLTDPGRSKGAGWNKACDTVVAGAKATGKDLDTKTTENLVFTDGDMMTGCTSCHQNFRDQKPPEGKLLDDKKPT
ncbi:MAG TPA: hypothetical protein VGO52_10190 [Hyphomonadaceae bacterium]|jgi:hypothetical protein|nr:hypothetical protein [Hyphomonadaceae bacterium]